MPIASSRAVVVATGVVLLLAGCSSPAPDARLSVVPSTPTSSASSAPVASNAVNIDNFGFAPASLTVKAGSTVTWTNHDEEPHTVAANDGSFHSPGLGAQGTYRYTFTGPGTFDYICSVHPFMHGTVVVVTA